ncbi:glycosyltransferase family 2 protein [Pedobacter sp. KLB.chiD]|uniref:glycosyltransferase family 2 protein n=1 Tax=Pedobacter sp. KLB.chiD TaxID=3387402 RepID=UPI00399A7C4E
MILKPSLALCIPAYNAAQHLPRILMSAKNQEIPFDEILVYDDCSNDNTKDVAESYGAKVIKGKINEGCSFGKNELAAYAKSDWLHFHDADDDLLPNFTQEIHQWIEKNGNQYQVLLLNFRYVNFKSNLVLGEANHNVDAMHADSLKYAIEHKIVNFGVYKKEDLIKAGGFDLDKKVLYNEDNAFHIRLATNGLKFDYLPKITCINYQYEESMSASNRLNCAKANYYVLEKAVKNSGKKYPIELASALLDVATILAAENDWKYVKKALNLSKQTYSKIKFKGSNSFKLLSLINPLFGYWMREKLIRFFKPSLRK